MALDNIKRPPTQVGGDQRAIVLFLCIFDRHDKPFGFVGADVEPRTTDRRHHLLITPDAEALGCPRMGHKIVGDVLCALPDPNVLRGYPKTFSHCYSEIMQPPCGNETQGDRKERVYSV